MPQLTAGDRTILRRKPVGRQWKLYVYQPEVVWGGTVDESPDQGADEFEVVTAVGNPANMIADSTIRITDSTNRRKLMPSKVRFKEYDAGPPEVLTVADNAIDWAVGDILTAVRLFEIWPRVYWVDPNTGEHYKDGEIDYTNDAAAQPPKANGGPAAIGDLVGGVCDITFRDEGSFAVPSGGAPASYLWTPLGGAPAVQAGALASTWVTLRYTTAGYYYMQYEVTDANGETGVRYIPVIIDDGTLCRRNVDVGDRYWDRMGWALSRRWIGVDQYGSYFYDGAPVFLVSDSYNTVPGAFAENRAKLRWSGWLTEENVDRTMYDRTVTYRAVSSSHILQNIPAFSMRLVDDSDPDAEASWYYYSDLSTDSAVYLLGKWHSTMMEVCDYHPTGEWLTRARLGENAEADDLLSQLNNILVAVWADLRCDRQGILRAMRHEWHLSAAEQAARATVMTLDPQDFGHVAYGPRRMQSTTRSVRVAGVDDADNPLLAGAPGDFILDGGRPQEQNYLAPIDQDEMNQWAGQHLAFLNWATSVRLRMTGEYDVVDPALGEYINANLYQIDDRLPRGTQAYSVIGVRFRDDHAAGVTIGEWELLPDPKAYPGSTIVVPEIPPEPTPSIPEDDYSPPIPKVWPYRMYVATFDKGVYYSSDFSGPDGAMPHWTAYNTIDGDGNTLADYGVHCFDVGPDDRVNYQYLIDSTDYQFYRRVNEANWTKEYTIAAADAALVGDGEANGTGRFTWFDPDPAHAGHIYALYRSRNDASSRSYVFKSTDHGDTFAFVSRVEIGVWPQSNPYTIHVYDNEVLVVLLRYVGSTIRAVYSDDYGTTWTMCSKIVGLSTNINSRGNYNRLQSDRVYLRGWGGAGSPEYELWMSRPVIPDPDSFELGDDPVTGDELVRQAPTTYDRGDYIWFDPGTAASQRLIRFGEQAGSRIAKYYTTSDSWNTGSISNPYDMPYWNICCMADQVNPEAGNMVVFGCEECDYTVAPPLTENVPTTRHHILVADTYDITDTYAKAGDDVSTPPYADSIPEDAGGVCHKGIKAVF